MTETQKMLVKKEVVLSSEFGVRRLKNKYYELRTKANVINNFTVPVGCVPRTHRLIGVIGDHALQGCKGIKRLNCGMGNAEYGIKTPNSELRTPNSPHPFPLPIGKKEPNKSPRPSERVGVRGVTLLEVILVIVIVGILVAIVVPKTNITVTSETSVNGAAYMIASDIRYTQECAMANRVSKSVSFVAGQNFYTFPATVPSTSGLDPSGRLISGVTTGTTITFTFNSLGEPIAGGGNSVTVSDGATTKTITVLQYTGKVNIS
jgi:prepilin-type N-terminal cleavage/methylation domain-containing protein